MISRREWMQGVAAGGAAVAAGAVTAAVPEPLVGGLVDAHVHVWTPDLVAYPLAEGFTRADMQPPSFTADELLALCRPLGVARVVLIQMSFYGFDNRFMLDSMARHPGTFGGVAIVDHASPGVVVRMRELAARGVRHDLADRAREALHRHAQGLDRLHQLADALHREAARARDQRCCAVDAVRELHQLELTEPRAVVDLVRRDRCARAG